MTNEMTAKEAVKILTYERDNDIFVTTEHRAKIHQALTMAIQALEAQPTEMRDATEEERKSVKDYIESISKPTGVRFDAQPTDAKETIIKSALKYLVKKQIEEGSVGFAVDNDHDHDCCWDDVLAWLEAQPSEDCISREEIKEFINVQLTDNEEWASSATYEGRWVEEKKYLYGVEILEGLSEYVNDLPSVTPKYTDEEIDKAQEIEQAYVDKMVELAVEELREKWLNSFDTSSATKCFEAVNLLKQRLEGEE